MESLKEKMIHRALLLLTERKVDAVLGFQRGTIPMMSHPILIRHPEGADQLHWDSFCSTNLANYLPQIKERIAIFAKGCDSRNLVLQILENQIKREQLYIIGVPCQGMLDRRKIQAELNGRELLGVRETSQHLHLLGEGFMDSLERSSYLQENCAICTHRNAVIHDELLAEPVLEQEGVDRYEDVRAIEAMTASKRWSYFEELLAPCIRCYACRNACPMCFCPVCFVDESTPQWLGKSIDPTDTKTFHFLRAYHLAGRCTDCGNCERACPMSIKVRQLTKKLEKDILEFYGYEAGLSLDQSPPLDTYSPDDPQEFIR
jgi:formate dehydrogenase subunit beta